MRTNYILILLSLLILGSCVKEEFLVDENIILDDANPTFAIPIGFADLTLADLEKELDSEDIITNEPGAIMAVVYEQEVIEFTLEDLLDLPDQQVNDNFEADALTAALFNTGQPGTQLPFNMNFDLPFTFENGEQLDSIRLQQAELFINVSSSFRHDIEVQFSIPELTLDGVPFTASTNLDYTGSLPVNLMTAFDVSDHLMDFTSSSGNALTIEANFIVTHSGEFTSPGDMLDFELILSSNSIKYAYGYLGQYTGLSESNSQEVDLFQDIENGQFYFADPALELTFYNSSGIPMEFAVTSIYDPQSSGGVTITGGGLDAIPTIEAASQPGEVAQTFHRIDNENMDPDLSDLLSDGPFELTYTAEATTNPDGFMQNWVLDTSTVTMEARVILPLHGYANNYVFADTIPSDLSEDLDLSIDSAGTLSTDDIEQVTFRIIADNGLPIDARVQVYFLDGNMMKIDSLFDVAELQHVIQAGYVNHTLEESDPQHGKVLSPTRAITDIVVDADRLQNLMDNNVMNIVIRAMGNTSGSQNESVIKFFPEYTLDIQLSAKIETNIDLSE